MKSTTITADDLIAAKKNPLTINQVQELPPIAESLCANYTIVAHGGDYDVVERMGIEHIYKENAEKIGQFNKVAYLWGRYIFW